jgi:hypothetical protein
MDDANTTVVHMVTEDHPVEFRVTTVDHENVLVLTVKVDEDGDGVMVFAHEEEL